ncbi:unnamed protein product [Cylicocyclus nassatus]|uniref:BED-type domain-containing protein n=1 Tax=Cylicocyclus nassatus TaxID=53992 RepID=A0AA36H2E0_CYLNA|nr:unnamed protein product [Cylicocyclus nassatus]
MSSVWNYYKKTIDADTNTECATCNFCEKSFRLPKSRTTTNLLEHVRRKHKTEVENLAKEAKMEAKKDKQEHKEHIDKNLIVFLAKASLPLHVTELPSFKEFSQSLNASYAVPSQKTLSNLMQKELANIDEENRRLCSGDSRVAITTDAWTSKNASCSMLAITGH